jgi:exodeoxyribonuclease V alpha subunit
VLGELCRHARAGHYTPATRDWLAAASGERIDSRLVDERAARSRRRW